MTTARDLPPWAADILESLPLLLDPEEAAKALGVSAKTIRRRIDEGSIVATKAGKLVRIPRLSVVQWLVANRSVG